MTSIVHALGESSVKKWIRNVKASDPVERSLAMIQLVLLIAMVVGLLTMVVS
jgi:hypothetical protein